jgi:thiamine-phosphate pyrophosphorylase
LLLYYITDRAQFPGDEAARRRSLLGKIADATRAGVDFIQLREKDLSSHELEVLAGLAMETILENSLPHGGRTRLLINSRADVAIACGAVVGISCHTAKEVACATSIGANFAVFAPVFEKRDAHPVGTAALRVACGHKIPILALGGVTLENARTCIDAGAAGIAGIRLFQTNDISGVVRRLRSSLTLGSTAKPRLGLC